MGGCILQMYLKLMLTAARYCALCAKWQQWS